MLVYQRVNQLQDGSWWNTRFRLIGLTWDRLCIYLLPWNPLLDWPCTLNQAQQRSQGWTWGCSTNDRTKCQKYQKSVHISSCPDPKSRYFMKLSLDHGDVQGAGCPPSDWVRSPSDWVWLSDENTIQSQKTDSRSRNNSISMASEIPHRMINNQLLRVETMVSHGFLLQTHPYGCVWK